MAPRALALLPKVAALLLWVPALAWAGNDESIPLGDDAAMTGGAVTAMVSDGSSLFYNPAGLAGAERDQVDVAATATLLRLYRLPQVIRSDAGALGDGSYTEFVSVPSAVSYVRALRPDLRLGLGLFAPEGASSTIDVSLQSGGNLFRLSTTNRESTYYATAGLGWRASPRLRLGLSVAALYVTQLVFASAWSQTGEGDGRRAFGLTQLFSASGIGVAATAGVQWQATDRLRLGLAVRSPLSLLFTAIDGSDTELDATTMPPSVAVGSADISQGGWDPRTERPLRVRAGAAWSLGRGWVGLDVDLQPPLKKDIGGDRRTTWNVRAGGILPVGKSTFAGAGLYTDRSPNPAPDGILEQDISYYGATLGLRMDHPHGLAADEKARSVIFSTTIALHYAWGIGDYGGLQFFEAPQRDGEPGTDIAAPSRVHELGLHLGSTLYF